MLINVVMGDRFNNDHSNIENFESDVVPQIGGLIITNKFGRNMVKEVLYDYRNIQPAEPEDRGSEMVFVFI